MFTLILGPMKSGKSLELIAQVAPYEHTDKEVLYVQPEANTRDKGVQSRLGVNATALTVKSLSEINKPFDVIGIDEIHMFDEDDAKVIDRWLRDDKNVIASGLDLDYRRKMLPIIIRLLEINPDKLIRKNAVCEICRTEVNAQFTQMLDDGEPVLGGRPIITIDDGKVEYQARCRDCFEFEGKQD